MAIKWIEMEMCDSLLCIISLVNFNGGCVQLLFRNSLFKVNEIFIFLSYLYETALGTLRTLAHF